MPPGCLRYPARSTSRARVPKMRWNAASVFLATTDVGDETCSDESCGGRGPENQRAVHRRRRKRREIRSAASC